MIMASCPIYGVIASIGNHLLALSIAKEHISIPGAKGDPAVAEKVIQPARYIA